MHTETRLSSGNIRVGPPTRGIDCGAILAVAALGYLALVTPSGPLRATTLAQTQLKGLTGINLYVHVAPDVGLIAKELEESIRARSLDLLSRARISKVAVNQEYLEVDVKAEPVTTESTPKLFAVFVSVRLREHVSLARNRSLDVPGGGALTWWRELLLTIPEPRLRDETEKTALDMVEVFTDEVQMENKSAGPTQKK